MNNTQTLYINNRIWAFATELFFGTVALLVMDLRFFFGIHIGYIIGFAAVERGDNILCVYTGRYLKVEEN